MLVSVVVLCHDQLEHVSRLVPQLLQQEVADTEFEVIVVDNGSSDGTSSWIGAQSDSRLQLVAIRNGVSRAAGRNRGIEVARGELLIMIDGDHTVDSSFIEAHVCAHQSETCAIVGKSEYAQHPDYAAISIYLNGCGGVKMPRGAELPGRYFSTGNCSLPRSVINKVGLFDESFERWGGEDLDLGMRIVHAGFTIYSDTGCVAIHHHFRHLGALLENKKEFGAFSIPLLIKKHPQLFQELNLDRLFHNPYAPNRFSAFHRALNRLLCTEPFYRIIVGIVELLHRRRVPRMLLDYLHLRQYARGYARATNPSP